MSRYEQKIKDGATRFLQDAEDVLAAVIAGPRGYTQAAVTSARGARRTTRGRRTGPIREHVFIRVKADGRLGRLVPTRSRRQRPSPEALLTRRLGR